MDPAVTRHAQARISSARNRTIGENYLVLRRDGAVVTVGHRFKRILSV